ncbi:nitroreductase family deazaflavin-dependent oxidoreductase [Salinispora mooreana]|uniref:nitroreductase family deazaflavin-dependent oxidoreductase n=1 Tax=Salinispora mooreana TaxID=999545 RepID=UPI00036C66A5|nr:nitroreductase family deazaflavin-dependent oxidoreductase [Salinispora mooreana]
MNPQTQRIGVIGLGEMGATIATRLQAVDADILVNDSLADAAARWPHEAWGHSAAAVARRCRVILVIVATDTQALNVVDDIASVGTPGTLVVLHSTVAPTTAREASDRLAARGIGLVDAGMSRGQGQMSDGSLTLFVGGDQEAIKGLRPVFSLYSDNVIHAGPVGAGMVLKLCNNLALHGNRAILIEAARIATAAGLDTEDLISGIVTSTGTSWVAKHWGRVDEAALDGGVGRTPMTARTERELGLILGLANEHHVEAPAAALVEERLPSVLAHGMAATNRAFLLAHKASRVEEWRSARDRAGAAFWSPMLVLTTTGARTARPRTCVLEFMIDNDRLMVFGSDGGRPADPAWCHNLRANPRVTVEIGSHTAGASAVVLPADEAADLYGRRARQRPDFARYRARAGQRGIPVIWLQPDVELAQLVPTYPA